MAVQPVEDIVRAICTDKWDGQRCSASLFKGENTSVSRLSVIPLQHHWDMFRQNVQKPPERLLALIGEINVGHLQRVGREYKQPVEITVEPAPVDWNPAHAIIPQPITRGLANQIIRGLKLHEPPRT